MAASLASHFIEERADVKLTLGTQPGASGAGREHLYDSLRRLALLTPEFTDGAADDARAEFWETIAPTAGGAADNFVILLTAAPAGSIPPHVWRASHVIYF
jgi:hypothetical protein